MNVNENENGNFRSESFAFLAGNRLFFAMREGVEKAKVEWEASKLTVEGKVDPTKLRDSLQEKTKKKVELVSPQPKKDKENRDDNATKSNKDSGKGQEKKKADEEKKPKEV